YRNDSRDRFPPWGTGDYWQTFQYGGGDPDRRWAENQGALSAINRPLWPYIPAREVFHCPADRGAQPTDFHPFDDTFRDIGTSYRYNTKPWSWMGEAWTTWQAPDDPLKGVAEKPLSWVPDHARFILLAEWPALPYAIRGPPPTWAIWHFSRSPRSLHSANAIPIWQKVVSPILFVDSHVAV